MIRTSSIRANLKVNRMISLTGKQTALNKLPHLLGSLTDPISTASLIVLVKPQICNRLALNLKKGTNLVALKLVLLNHKSQILQLTRDPTSQARTLILTDHTTMSLLVEEKARRLTISSLVHKNMVLPNLDKILILLHLVGKTHPLISSSLNKITTPIQPGITLSSLSRLTTSPSSSPNNLNKQGLLRHLNNLANTVVPTLIRHLLNSNLSSNRNRLNLQGRLLPHNIIINSPNILDLSRFSLIVMLNSPRDKPHL